MNVVLKQTAETVPFTKVPEGSYFTTKRGTLYLLVYEDVPGQGRETIHRHAVRMSKMGAKPIGEITALDDDAECVICEEG